ncbi:sigma-70 family RNA polymerase sigma factor [Spirosoma sp. HMF4905]|uniref:RNA polymerase sigma factor n=1 Tax=Spirosoma arboris TaxID=2682092 RepID=A0A7K1S935_9BACT|nr:RNA polymerase sigma factor [Spirosoma arboris]MVM30324.1 sigma-70 family RNA polymerase sigma factor [Spirosoma arboris]
MNATYPTEELLVCALQNHRSADFSLLYDSYSPALYGVLLRLVKDPDRAEDLLQDAFIKIWSNSQNYNPKQGRLFTWLLTITRNLAMDELRARKVRATAATYIYAHEVDSTSPRFAEGMLHQSLLSQLAPKYQTVVELMYYRDYTSQEAADILKLPLGTVKTRMRAALQQLKQFFDQDIQHYHAQYGA